MDSWSVDQVCDWLASPGVRLAQHEASFREAEINGSFLAVLDSAILQELGVSSGPERVRLLAAIATLRQQQQPSSSSMPNAPRQGDPGTCAHHHEPIHTYCLSCGELLCSVCARHVSHENHKFERIMETDSRVRAEVAQLRTENEIAMRAASTVAEFVKGDLKKVKAHRDACTHTIKERFKALRELLDKEERKALDKVEDIAEQSLAALHAFEQAATDLTRELQKQVANLEPLQRESAHVSEIFLLLKEHKERHPNTPVLPQAVPQVYPELQIIEQQFAAAMDAIPRLVEIIQTKESFIPSTCNDVKVLAEQLTKAGCDEEQASSIMKRLDELCGPNKADKEAQRRMLYDCGGVRGVLDAMRVHKACAALAADACLVLGNMCCNNKAASEASHTAGGVMAALEALRTHARNEQVAEIALCFLGNMCGDVQAARVQACKDGVVALALAAMTDHPAAALLNQFACALFWGLAFDASLIPEMKKAGVVAAIRRARAAHGGHEGVQSGSAGALKQMGEAV